MASKYIGLAGLALLTILGLLQNSRTNAKQTHGDHGEDVEIAAHMGELQRFSQKLGYAANSGNQRLISFYGEEIGEALGELKEVETHDGFPIANTVKVIMDPIMEELSEAIEKRDMPALKSQYLSLIDGCNRCHAATEHEFIEITPATGAPPFNQKF